ncbi:unnamed protein product, partial [Closterium sp. NIES-64]
MMSLYPCNAGALITGNQRAAEGTPCQGCMSCPSSERSRGGVRVLHVCFSYTNVCPTDSCGGDALLLPHALSLPLPFPPPPTLVPSPHQHCTCFSSLGSWPIGILRIVHSLPVRLCNMCTLSTGNLRAAESILFKAATHPSFNSNALFPYPRHPSYPQPRTCVFHKDFWPTHFIVSLIRPSLLLTRRRPYSAAETPRRQRPCNTPSAAAARARTSPRPFLPQPSPPVSSSSDASRPPLPRVPVPAFPERKRPQGQLKRNADAQPPSPRHRMTKKVRKAITVKEKLHWLKLQDSQPDLGNRALAKLAKVQPCQIREWRKMKERLDVASGCRRRLMGFGRKAKYPFMERAVYRHFLNH